MSNEKEAVPTIRDLQTALMKYSKRAKSREVERLDARLLDGEPAYIFLIHEWLMDIDQKLNRVLAVLDPTE